jgi:hypothetical protein
LAGAEHSAERRTRFQNLAIEQANPDFQIAAPSNIARKRRSRS